MFYDKSLEARQIDNNSFVFFRNFRNFLTIEKYNLIEQRNKFAIGKVSNRI